MVRGPSPPQPYPIPADEMLRLRDLERHAAIGLASDPHFERLVDLAASLFEAPMVAISLVDAERQWFLASRGLGGVCETPRSSAFCAHAIAADGVMVVPDALEDERFRTNPLVLGPPHIRFYAGAPLRSPDGHNLGTLCVLDHQPRPPLEPRQRHWLQSLADQVMRELELRRLALHCPVTGLPNRPTFLMIGERELRRARSEDLPLALLLFDIDNFRQINSRWGHAAGDRLLQDLCALCRSFLKEQDYAGRLGDGEFALLLVNRDPQVALQAAEELRLAVTRLPGVHSHSDFALHISGGLTALAPADHTFDDLLQRAVRALHLAKSNGRNQIARLMACAEG
jgi:diguanylate cyclase (GGDEF)-like protein